MTSDINDFKYFRDSQLTNISAV